MSVTMTSVAGNCRWRWSPVTTGTLNSLYLLSADETALAGTWHVLVQPGSGYTPFGTNPYSTIVASPATYGTAANDAFEVQTEVIPEFPTAVGAGVGGGLLFAAYC